MIKLLLSKWILKEGGVKVLLWVGNLIVNITPSEKDNKMWEKIKPIILKYK